MTKFQLNEILNFHFDHIQLTLMGHYQKYSIFFMCVLIALACIPALHENVRADIINTKSNLFMRDLSVDAVKS